MMTPKISIITPCFNRAEFIAEAVESVLSQNSNDFEHIVIDGGSTDGTLELLSSYPHLRVWSEPDKGVYDALNKGLLLARGEIIGQLNTDDYYQPNIFKQIQDYFAKNPEVDVICGSGRVFENDSDGNEETIARHEPVNQENFLQRVTTGVIIFNAWFFRRRVFDTVGSYLLEYPLLADRDFLIRCWLNKMNMASLDLILYHYRQHPGSLTINLQGNVQTRLRVEALRLAEKYLDSLALNLDAKKYFIEWHDLTAIELLIDYVRQRKISNFLTTLVSAIHCNPKWLLLIVMQSSARIKNYLKKNYDSNH